MEEEENWMKEKEQVSILKYPTLRGSRTKHDVCVAPCHTTASKAVRIDPYWVDMVQHKNRILLKHPVR
jgi:hypothetical protein